jgi:ribosome biogenesis GTPase A
MAHDALLNSLRLLANVEVLPPAERRLAAETAAKLAEALVYVAVIGEFKRGKSTLINALLGEDVLRLSLM